MTNKFENLISDLDIFENDSAVIVKRLSRECTRLQSLLESNIDTFDHSDSAEMRSKLLNIRNELQALDKLASKNIRNKKEEAEKCLLELERQKRLVK